MPRYTRVKCMGLWVHGSDIPKTKLQQIIAHDTVLEHQVWLLAGLPWMFSISLESQSTYFLKFLTASHKYVSSSEPQAFQNIQCCLIKSRYEANTPAWCGCLEMAATNSLFHYQVFKSHSFPSSLLGLCFYLTIYGMLIVNSRHVHTWTPIPGLCFD